MKCECIFICHCDCNRKDGKRQKAPEKASFVLDTATFLLVTAIFDLISLQYGNACGKIVGNPKGGAATVQYVLYYFIAVSVIGAIVCIYDKLAAARGWRRVPERTLFFWALIGGGPGVYATMLIIRHKTLHHIFMLGIPAIMILQGAIIIGIYNILYMKGLL